MSIKLNNNKRYTVFLAIFLGTFATAVYAAIGRPFLDSTPYQNYRDEIAHEYEEKPQSN